MSISYIPHSMYHSITLFLYGFSLWHFSLWFYKKLFFSRSSAIISLNYLKHRKEENN